MCFMHNILNVLDLHKKGYEATLVIEGEAVRLIKELIEGKNKLFNQMIELELIHGVCKACSAKLGVLEYNENSPINIIGDMQGHPSVSQFTERGFQVITL